jgi:predicted Zn finger-like uncharacterized protein
MPQAVSCPSCASRLRIPEQALGKRVRCPNCNYSFVAEGQAAPPADPPAEKRTTPLTTGVRQATADDALARRKAPPPVDEEPIPEARRAPRADKPEEPEELEQEQEPTDEGDEAPAETPKKKKKKKKRRRRRDDDDTESPMWPWLAFGGGGAALLLFVLLVLTAVLDWDNPVKYAAAYLLFAIPGSTVIFFVAMFLSSVLAGAVEIGELHVAAVKAFALVVIVQIVTVVTLPISFYASFALSFIVSVIGLMSLFRLDIWEARIIVGVNSILNLCLFLALIGTLHAIVTHADKGGDVGGNRPGPPSPAVQKQGWDEGDVEELGGTVELDPKNQNDDIVLGISFRDTKVSDADLAHMKEFPRLEKLDLTRTPITDKGLRNLTGCKKLQVLILTKTKVTDAGVKDLQADLPNVQIVR